ncbi:DUF418 domain-containing protein [Schinkia azotoformans]|nr:DUF418 domain-containing protein [Schinkia azotoformans]MEC1715157.1 DUF418 domain-containing protein [Schinkia azotoformans]MEC1739793.1 DUF418 domain-containing protein [Schinkia azotoformans]MEC1745582.1 DUF418 domain-containing protein [Schinkia azotoformans]MEC1765082.1 DUF418 domain-containing protein [Schinkia azotoformans]MEC1788535.1 DUF418 domain-containing protein [Schinkia azotoformans]
MNPSITQKERIISLDIIRGIALFGILLINVGAFKTLTDDVVIPDYNGINEIVAILTDILVEKKFFSIFSFLFGVGFYIFASRAESRGDRPRWCFARRLLALLLIGIIHFLFFWGSILAVYAVIGFLLIPFYRAKVSTISKWIGGIITVYILSQLLGIFAPDMGVFSNVIAFLGNDSITIFIMFLSGFLAAKADWIRKISDLTTEIRWIQIVTLPLFISFSIWIWFASQGNDPHIQEIIALGTIPTTYLYLSSLFVILENKRIAKLLQPIARVGQMAFTNYWAQSFIGLAIISIMDLEVVSPINIVIISIIIFAIQIIYSVIWFKFFKMGPLEKVWRFMTYGRNGASIRK